MESRQFALLFLGPPTSGKSTFATYLEETLHLPIINGSMIVDPKNIPGDGSLVEDSLFVPSLQNRLSSEPPTGHIFDGIPRTANQAKVLAEWSLKHNFPLHIIDLDLLEEEVLDRTINREVCSKCRESYHYKIKPSQNFGKCDIDGGNLTRRSDDSTDITKARLTQFHRERDSILGTFDRLKQPIYRIDANGTIKNTSRRIFQELSPLFFEDPLLSPKYFAMKDFCEANKLDFMLISGACCYIYRGRRPLKDLDILIPRLNDLQRVARSVNRQVELIKSSYAISQYLNYSSGVELVADLSVRDAPFNFFDLAKDSRRVRFMGEDCMIMSPEWLIVFKLCLGRSDQDDFGHIKNDFADAYDVTVSQPIDYEKVRLIAKQIGAEEKVESGLKILSSCAY